MTRLTWAGAFIIFAAVWHTDLLPAAIVLAGLFVLWVILFPPQPPEDQNVVDMRTDDRPFRPRPRRRLGNWSPRVGIGIGTHGPFAWLSFVRRFWR